MSKINKSANAPSSGKALAISDTSNPSTPAEINQPISLETALRRGELFSADCPSRQVFKHVTSLWGVLIMMALLDGTHRFSELRRKVNGVSEKMLAQSLQNLEADGFLLRKVYPVVPPHVEYRLTTLGEEIAHHVKALVNIVEINFPNVAAYQYSRQAGADGVNPEKVKPDRVKPDELMRDEARRANTLKGVTL